MDEAIAAQLLASIQMDRLVVFCGAGLSMASPGNLPSARQLANICFDKYEQNTGSRLPDLLHDNLEQIAQYFWDRNDFTKTFIQWLVPWDKLSKDPNGGHYAIADFLGCGAIEFTLSTNVDYLIESAAKTLGESDFQNSIGNDDIGCAYTKHKPLLKIHGCYIKDRGNTVWCSSQLQLETIQNRLDKIRQWLLGRLLSKDVVIIGFWSDWAYLNEILNKCINTVVPNLVILVDPLSDAQLEEKAPSLWRWARNEGLTFIHIQESGDAFLECLRKKFSVIFLRKLLDRSKQSYHRHFGTHFSGNIHIGDNLDVSALYDIRRDVCGTPINEIVRYKNTDDTFELIGLFHLWLISLGAAFDPPFFKYGDKVIRLINAPGVILSTIKNRYSNEPIQPKVPDLNVCVGAVHDYSPADIVKGDQSADIIRSGLSGKWITEKDLPFELGVQEQ
jgi:NAD-dependent SIR2 family protein deacetylase